jgi:hypothetical protein
MVWTQFWDMHSGGGTKEPPYDQIYIEAAREEAESIFYAKFGHSPSRVSCTCCGQDYSIDEHETIEDATAYHRGCRWDDETNKYVDEPEEEPEEGEPRRTFNPYLTVEEYEEKGDVLFVREDEIGERERYVRVPKSGYVWVD